LPRTLCNIRLNKLTTLSLWLFPPLKPFERRDHSYRCVRRFSLYRVGSCIALGLVSLPYSTALARGAGRAIARTEGVIPSSSGLFASYALQHTPQQTLHPVASRHPSSQTFQEEGAFYRYTRWKL